MNYSLNTARKGAENMTSPHHKTSGCSPLHDGRRGVVYNLQKFGPSLFFLLSIIFLSQRYTSFGACFLQQDEVNHSGAFLKRSDTYQRIGVSKKKWVSMMVSFFILGNEYP